MNVDDACDDGNDNHRHEEKQELGKRDVFWYVFWKEFVDLWIYAMSIGGLFSLIYAMS